MEVGSSNVGGSGVARESRRRKTVWQAWQKKALLAAFTKNSYPSFEDRMELASQMGIPESRIRVWFQNRRNRTRRVGHAPKRSTRGSRQLASQQLAEELGSRAQGRGMPSDNRRPRTRLTSPQRRILVQAFERNPRPGFATREELVKKTGLSEDTIYTWFQNRRARHHSRGRLTAQDQDLLASPGPDGAPGGPIGREHEGAQLRLGPLAAAGAGGMDSSRSSDLPALGTESQLPQMPQPSGPGQARAPIQASNPGPPELLLEQVVAEIQVEENAPAPLDHDGGPGGREQEGAQDSLLPLAEAGCVGMDASKFTDSLAFGRESQPPQVAQPSGPGQAQAPTQASNTGPLELLLDQLLDEFQAEEHAPAFLDLGGREEEGCRDSLWPLAEAGCVGMDSWSPSDLPSFCGGWRPPQVAQPSGAAQGQAPTQASNPDPLELLLDQLLPKGQVDEQEPGPLDLQDEWEQMDTLSELPLTQEEYQALLETL